jgi:hypothetical protein
MIHDRVVALIFRIACLTFTFAGLMSVVRLLDGLDFSILMYYTIQSNLLALVLFGLLTVRTVTGLRQDGRTGKTGYYPRFEMVVVIDLLVTLIVYWALLAPAAISTGVEFSSLLTFSNIALHLITPLLCVIDYFLFTDSGHLKYKDIYFVLIFPLAYLALTSTAGFMGYVYRIAADGSPVRFPYFFYDYDRIGAAAFLYIGGLILFFLLLSHGLYFFDQKVQKPVWVPK